MTVIAKKLFCISNINSFAQILPSRFSCKFKMAKICLRDFLASSKWQNSAFEIFSQAQNGKILPSRFSRKLKMAKFCLRDFLASTKWQNSAFEIFSQAQNGKNLPSRFSRKLKNAKFCLRDFLKSYWPIWRVRASITARASYPRMLNVAIKIERKNVGFMVGRFCFV